LEDPAKEDRILISAIASSISKIAFYISLCIIAGMFFSNCKVDADAIETCENACGVAQGIKEVTAWSCTCNDLSTNPESMWVLPN